MKIKTSELTGAALDWSVAKGEGHEVAVAEGSGLIVICRQPDVINYFDPSTNWGWGGPIIERERADVSHWGAKGWKAHIWSFEPNAQFGPTLLIATMRCYVCSKFGGVVEVPDELCC